MKTYLTTEKLSEFLSISVQTLNKWRWEGKGPRFCKLGSRVVYDLADVEAYVAAQVRSSTTANPAAKGGHPHATQL